MATPVEHKDFEAFRGSAVDCHERSRPCCARALTVIHLVGDRIRESLDSWTLRLVYKPTIMSVNSVEALVNEPDVYMSE